MPTTKAILPTLATLALLIVGTFYLATNVFSATATHIVISEVQIGGTTSKDEFVELYNPTNSPISISGWRLTRINSGDTENNLVASFGEVTIAARSYYLVAHPNYDGSPDEDLEYSAPSNSIADDSTVLLYSDAGATLIDKVGMGDANDYEGLVPTGNPTNDNSRERKANSSSTTQTMMMGGSDEFGGNGEDTDNNGPDFVVRTESQPQNSESPAEIPSTATPTATPTQSPSPTPTTTPTETPTPSPTESPTPSPTESPSPSPTESPSPSPTESPSPTPTPTESPSPSPTPEPTPKSFVIGMFLFPGRTTVCRVTFENKGRSKSRFFRRFIFPRITCERVF